jgi:endonuclease YncB( thermonuclease family)
VEINRFRHATVQRVIDGDTVDLSVDCLSDPQITLREHARLEGIQAADVPPEAKLRAKDGLTTLLDATASKAGGAWLVTAKMLGRDKYGRLLVRLYGVAQDGSGPVDLNQEMLGRGFAVPWNGQGTKPLGN